MGQYPSTDGKIDPADIRYDYVMAMLILSDLRIGITVKSDMKADASVNPALTIPADQKACDVPTKKILLL